MSVLKVCPQCGIFELGDNEKCVDCGCYYRKTDYNDTYWNACNDEKKAWIIKKYCPNCDADSIVGKGREIARMQEERAKEIARRQEEQFKISMQKIEEEQREYRRKLAEASPKIILTTGPSVEGRYIKEYKGIATGVSTYSVGVQTQLGGNYIDSEQVDARYRAAVMDAEKQLRENAFKLGADAVVGIQTVAGGPGTLNYLVVALTGTAVITEELTPKC